MKYFLLTRGKHKWFIIQTDTEWRAIYYIENGIAFTTNYKYPGKAEEWIENNNYTETLTPTTMEQFVADYFSDIL